MKRTLLRTTRLSTTWLRATWLVSFAATSFAAIGLASAQAPADAPASPAAAPSAEELASRFAEAQRAFDAGRHEDALRAFQSLVDQTKSPNAMLYVARSLRGLRRLPAAHDAMRATLREASARAAAEPKYNSTRDAAAAELAALALEVSFVVVAIADAPDGAQVSLDGAPLEGDRIGSPVTVEPGAHAVELSAPGSEPVRRSISVVAGETKTIALAAGSGAPPPTAPPAEKETSGGGLRIAGFIVGGVGLASVGVGVVTGLMADGEFADLEDSCGSARCTDPGAADTIDSGKSLETIANVTLIGGAILVAASVPLIVFGGPSESGGATALSVGPGGAAVRWSAAF